MSDSSSRIAPRIETESRRADRLVASAAVDAELEALPTEVLRPGGRVTTLGLAIGGVAVLILGLGALEVGNFVADEFRRAVWLGWLTLVIAVSGFGLILAAIGHELRGLASLEAVDRLRAELNGKDAVARHRAARRWVSMLPAAVGERQALLPALDAVNDPDALLALLVQGPGRRLRVEVDALSRRAALQVAATLAATPSAGLAGLVIAWRGIRLLRQIAALHGLRPGLLATMGLIRRTVFAAGAVAAGEAVANAAAHALLSNPLLGRLAGEMAGAGIAARRMIVMGRAAAAASTPLAVATLSRDEPPTGTEK
ncbi:putative membrane protein [Endobacter medicaginis]|uniref:Putative membrane protein n=3 Tax=Endobacter medicaginis TaxID=1181271 RepID=A0A839USM1_9PROT|nr:putative membrane protein [Endobacter medicaginis]MCX5476370.1 DUF697 domain-containing protein [Endobacter medicaginis]